MWITVTLQVQPKLVPRRAVREWNVKVGNVVEKVDLIARQHQACGYRMDRRIAPSFVEEATRLVEEAEKVGIRL